MALAPRSLTGVRVLCVEDDPDTLTLMTILLGAAGATVVPVAAFDRERPDVLVSDAQMPGRDGYGLIEQVRTWSRARGGKTPAIAVSGCASDADISHSLLAGFDAHLAKPIEMDELIRTIVRLVDRDGIPNGATV
jgi:CheY-like chemotaxis protein